MGKQNTLACFKAYDLRGKIPEELNEDIAWLTGYGFAQTNDARRVVTGRDARASSEPLRRALEAGLRAAGAHVETLGVCGTEEVYFATFHGGFDGGLMVTGSHNPLDYNGIKIVGQGATPLSADQGLGDIKNFVAKHLGKARPAPAKEKGTVTRLNNRRAYVEHLMGYVKDVSLKPLKIVVNAGNGPAGLVVDQLEKHLPFEFIKINHQPDATFPNGIPNPFLPENRAATVAAVKKHKADLGIAWDGDFDRCFLFDETGNYVSSYYLVGMLAAEFLRREPGARIIYDPRLTWNTIETVMEGGGTPVVSKAGHSFIKRKMRDEDAVYGGEISGHFFFRDFGYCDSGMIPWLLVTAMISRENKPLSALIGDRWSRYPASDEINRRLEGDVSAVIKKVEGHYGANARAVAHLDGLSMEFEDWRFNLRPSNTEPLLRLNVEARTSAALMENKLKEIISLIET